MRKQFKKMALGVTSAMVITMAAPAAQPVFAGTEVYEITLGTPEERKVTERTLEVGDTLDLNFYGVKDWGKNKENYKCEWSADSDAVTVSKTGVVTAVKGGSATVSFSITDTVTGVSHTVVPVVVTVPGEETTGDTTPVEAPKEVVKDYVLYTLREDGKSYMVSRLDGYWGDSEWNGVVTIPAECCGLPVTEIAPYALAWDVTEVTLPNTITLLGEDALSTYIGTKITYHGTKAEWYAIEKKGSSDDLEVTCTDGMLPETMVIDHVVYQCASDGKGYYVKNLKVIDLLKEIGRDVECSVTIAAECNGLPVTTLGGGAFSDLAHQAVTRLNLVIPESITVIGNIVSSGTVLTIQYNGTTAEWSKINKELMKEAPEKIEVVCTDGTVVEKTVQDGVSYQLREDGTSYAAVNLKDYTLKTVVVAAECNGLPVVSATFELFNWWSGESSDAEEIKLPDSVTEFSIYGGEYLKTINIPAGVTKLGEDALLDTPITELRIPKTVTEIAESAFGVEVYGDEFYCDGCTVLEKVFYEGTVAEWKALSANVIFPGVYEAVCSDGTYLEEKQVSLELNEDGTGYRVTGCGTYYAGKIEIPAEYNGLPVTEISGLYAGNSAGFKELRIPASVTKINQMAFWAFWAKEVVYEGTCEECYRTIVKGEYEEEDFFWYEEVICTDGTATSEGYKEWSAKQ